MNVLVYGLGRSGEAAARLLVRQGHRIWLFDERLDPKQCDELDALGATATDAPLTAPVELCIAAPGVPWDHRDLVALRDKGIETIGEVEWVYRSVPADMVGITGTAGKTTVTSWIARMAHAAGLKAAAGGNLDPALAAVAEPGTLLIAELSSFQLERSPRLKPKLAVVLNVGVDHLDRHGTAVRYHEAKRALLANLTEAETLIYNADDQLVSGWAKECPSRRMGFSLREPAHAYHADDTLFLLSKPLIRRSDLLLAGEHQLANALAVALAGHALGISRERIADALEQFPGVPGRYSLAGVIAGVRFVDDSVATKTVAVKAALEATPPPIVWIGGGVDKGADLNELLPLVRERVALFAGIGSSGGSFAAQLKRATETAVCEESDGAKALMWACRLGLARLRAEREGTVLLAPLAASFDQFKDYRARAVAFRQAVKTLEADEEAAWTPS